MRPARSILLSRRRPRRSYRDQSGGGPPRRRSLPLPRRLLLLRRPRPPGRRRPRPGSSCTAGRTTLSGSCFCVQANRLGRLPEMQRLPRGRRPLPSPGRSREIVCQCFMVLCRAHFCWKRMPETVRGRESKSEKVSDAETGRTRESQSIGPAERELERGVRASTGRAHPGLMRARC